MGKKKTVKYGKWIPVSERLPERDTGGAWNWQSVNVIVCAYGNACSEGWEDYDYEILTGNFTANGETEKGELWFEPDRFTLFVPDDWDVIPLDKDFKGHLSKEECTFYTDDSCTETEFHDRYIQILAWMPLPKPYKGVERLPD